MNTSRTRIIDSPLENNTIELWWTKDAVKSEVSLYTHPYARQFKGMSDVVVSDYKKRVARGEMFFNPMQKETLRITSKPTVQRYRTRFQADSDMYGGQWYFALPEQFGLTESVLFNEYNLDAWHAQFDEYADSRSLAVTKAYANVDQSELLGLASIGEMPETVRWFGTVLSRAVAVVAAFTSKKKALSAIRRARHMSAEDYTDALSNLWLEVRYAIRPLAFEVEQALTALKTAIERSGRFTARGGHTDITSESSLLETWNTHITHQYAVTTSTMYKARAGVVYTILDDTTALLSHWGLDQPLEAIWELIPGSFILDWFFNIGSVISSWSINASLGILGSYVTETITSTGKVEFYGYNVHSTLYLYAVDSISPGMSTYERISKRRVITPERGILPTCNLKLDVAKIIDLVTIGRNLLK